MGVGDAAVLDVEQGLAQRGSRFPSLARTDREAARVVPQLTDRGDHGRGTAGEDLRHQPATDPVQQFRDADPPLYASDHYPVVAEFRLRGGGI